MALLDSLMDKATETINDSERQKKWIEKGFDSAIKSARDLIPAESNEAEIKALAETASYAFDKIERHKGTLVGLGEHGLRSTITHLGLGKYDEAAKHAALLQLRTSGSWDDVNALITGTAQDGNQAKRELDAKIAEIKEVLKDIGVTAGKAALPFLLAAL